MNAITLADAPADQENEINHFTDATWPLDVSTWNEGTAAIYRSMDRRKRFEMARPLREKAQARVHMDASEHLMYALLKGKSPFRAFSPYNGPRSRQASYVVLLWGGLVNAIQKVERHLKSLEGVLYVDKTLLGQLWQLLRMTKLRTMGLNLASMEDRTPAARQACLKEAMRITPQGNGTVADHCIQTHEAFRKLTGFLYFGDDATMPLPTWANAYREQLGEVAWSNRGLMKEYLTMHDCGKPFCLTYDEAGRSHFPNHAFVSGAAWLAVGGAPRAASLMAQDMDLHTLKAEEVSAFAKRPDTPLLLLSGIASLHANAQDFGGTDSDSFKIKMKRLQSRGQRICELVFGAGQR